MSAVQGWTPLQSAVSAGHDQVAQRLLELHADPNAANSGGRTALHYTVRDSALQVFLPVACALPPRGAPDRTLTPVQPGDAHGSAPHSDMHCCRLHVACNGLAWGLLSSRRKCLHEGHSNR